MGARPYDPAVGRFLAVDPVDGGSLNNYDYAGQDPINNYDLDGAMLSGVNGLEDGLSPMPPRGTFFAAGETSPARGTVGSGTVYKRPGSFRKSTTDTLLDEAPKARNGDYKCATCSYTAPSRSDFHFDHWPLSNRQIVQLAKREHWTRTEYLDRYNDPMNLRLRCPSCNVRDNQR
jgi:hypothetical protein